MVACSGDEQYSFGLRKKKAQAVTFLDSFSLFVPSRTPDHPLNLHVAKNAHVRLRVETPTSPTIKEDKGNLCENINIWQARSRGGYVVVAARQRGPARRSYLYDAFRFGVTERLPRAF